MSAARLRLAGVATALILLGLVAAAVLAGPGYRITAKLRGMPPGVTAMTVSTRPVLQIGPARVGQRIGAMEFRGGLALSSDNPGFGGISGMALAEGGARLVAVSDAGLWITGRIVEQDGRLTGIDEARIGPVLGPDGRTARQTGFGDTESLALDGGIAYVGAEGANIVGRFDLGRDGLLARGQEVPTPPAVRRLPYNRGLEALAVAPAGSPLEGALVAISERSGSMDEPTVGFILGGPHAGQFQVVRQPPYDITDAAFLPGGDLLVLERSFSLWRGFGMRLRRITGAQIRPGASLDGPVLLELHYGDGIDNMEAMAVSRGPQGEDIVTLMSDDNYMFLQRTLMLRFALVGG